MLDRRRAQLDALEHAGVQDVDTSIDTVSDEFDWLLDETVNPRGVVWLVNDDTVFRGFLNLCDDDGTLVAVGLVESSEIRKGVVADNVRVQDKKRRIILSKNFFRQL